MGISWLYQKISQAYVVYEFHIYFPHENRIAKKKNKIKLFKSLFELSINWNSYQCLSLMCFVKFCFPVYLAGHNLQLNRFFPKCSGWSFFLWFVIDFFVWKLTEQNSHFQDPLSVEWIFKCASRLVLFEAVKEHNLHSKALSLKWTTLWCLSMTFLSSAL